MEPRGKLHSAIILLLLSVAGGMTPAAAQTPQQEAVALAAVLESLSMSGTPYIYGGTSSRGLDCSGLVYLVYAPLVPDLPRRAVEQYRFGNPVASDKLEPGDLVFFNTEGWTASHVGIYIGQNRFVHAASGEHTRGIVLSSLTTPYYADRFVGARRVALP